MGIFSRIGDIMKANVNDLIDKAEDPEKMVKQIIRDLQQEVAKSTQALGKAMASQRIAERQYKTALQSSADWESKAKAALAAGNTEMAKKALSYKVKADNYVASYQMYETITTQTDAIRNQVETLKAKLEEAKSRQAMLIARSQMAKTQKNLAQSMGGINTSSSMDKFNRMEEKIMQQEAEAAAFAEISGNSNADTKSFEQMEADTKVDAELQRLMAEMGTSTSDADLDAQLAALEQGGSL